VPLVTFVFELRAVFKGFYRKICPVSFWFAFPVILCPAYSCSVTHYDLLKPIAFSFVGNFSQTLQFILCPVYYLRLVAFWTILTRVQLLLRLASKSSRFLLLWILLPNIFVLLISCHCVALWAGLSFFSFFVLSFASEQVKRILRFSIVFIFIFPFPSVCSKRIVLQIIVVLQLFYLLLFCLLLLPTRRGKMRCCCT